LEVGTDGHGFKEFRMEQSYTPESPDCDECQTAECECEICPDDNAPPFFTADLTSLPWNPSGGGGCCMTMSTVVILADCSYYFGVSDIGTNILATFDAIGEPQPDQFCNWSKGVAACGTPGLLDVIVLYTDRGGDK